MSYHIISYIMSYHISCHVIIYHITSYIISYRIMSCHVMSYVICHVISHVKCRHVSCHKSCHISCHIYHIIISYIISHYYIMLYIFIVLKTKRALGSVWKVSCRMLWKLITGNIWAYSKGQYLYPYIHSRRICSNFWGSIIANGAKYTCEIKSELSWQKLHPTTRRLFTRWMELSILIYLFTVIGLTTGGSSSVHIYTQTVHRTIQLTTHRTTQFWNT